VVSTDPLLIDYVIRRMRNANFTIKMAYADYLLLLFTGNTINLETRNLRGVVMVT